MSNTSTSRLGLTQPTFENINLLHVCAGAPKEKLRYSVSAASDRVDGAVGDATQTGGALTLLAIDLGTTTGWALRPRDQQIAHGFVTCASNAG
jgi:hypothetical protein